MKLVTLNVEESIYERFRAHAARTGCSAAELVRQAMAEYSAHRIPDSGSIFDTKPYSVGRVLRDVSAEDDLLEEMLNDATP